MRIALNLGLHLALERLADNSAPQRSDEEERDLSKSGPCLISSCATD